MEELVKFQLPQMHFHRFHAVLDRLRM
jgi:hypothetical protein